MSHNPGGGPPRWPSHRSPSPSPFRIPPPPPPGWNSPIPPPHMTQSPPLFLIRPTAGRQSPMPFGRSSSTASPSVSRLTCASPTASYMMPPLPNRQFFQQIITQNSKTEQMSITSSSSTTTRSEQVHRESKKYEEGFGEIHLEPSYDMEFVYPPGMEPTSFQRQISVGFSEDGDDGGPTTAEIIAAQSQDYIDERLAEYQATIQHLQDEQERVQKKTFVNWINSYLAKHIPPLHVVDLIEDLKDGTRLLALLEVLSGEKLPVEKGKNLRRPHFLSNCNTAVQFLQSKNIKLVNINSSDVVDGKPAVVLGLIWTIILYFQLRCRDPKVIEENTKLLAGLGYRLGAGTPISHLADVAQIPTVQRPERGPKLGSESPSFAHRHGRTTPSERWKHGARKALLQWVQSLVNKKFGLDVNDFGASWRDGYAFVAIINCIQPGLIDMNSIKNMSNRTRLETAFRIAEEELGVPRLLDPEDVDVMRPDEKSIMTYVAQFLHKSNQPKFRADSFSAVQSIYDELLTWLLQKTQYMEHMKQTNSLSKDYQDYVRLVEEMNIKSEPFNRLKTLVESKSMVGITQEAWNQLNSLWIKLEAQLKEWQWRLDSLLPEPFGHIGQWLGKAEQLLNTNDVPAVMNDEAARILNSKIEEHKAFFARLPTIQSEYTSALNLPVVHDLPAAQIKSMTLRLSAAGPLAAKRAVRLKFLEHKCCLVAFIVLIETRLKQWTVKYGRPEHVQTLLDQYNNFVNRNKIFQEFERAYVDMQHVVVEYKQEGGIDNREGRMADHFLWEVGERWKSVSMELRCVQSMLEEVITHWKRYETIAPELNLWVDQALPMLNLPSEQERMEYFQDVGIWLEKYQQLHDTVNFLLATCDTPVATELKNNFSTISAKWNKLFQHVKQYQYTGEMLRMRRDFLQTLDGLQNWLRNSENILSMPVPITVEAARQYNSHLEGIHNEIDGMDETWRLLSKKFQSLVPELAKDDVENLMRTLKKEKESLVKVRAQLPQKQSIIRQLLDQQESVDMGLNEIGEWVNKGQGLLNSYALRGGTHTQDLLEQHRQFFMKSLYYKSMLESKNRQMGGIMHGAGADERTQLQDVMDKMNSLNINFALLEGNAHRWEQKLNEALRCWRNYEENKQIVSDWVTTADQLLNEKNLEAKQTVEAHKNFFEHINDVPMRNLIQSSQDLEHSLDQDEYQSVKKNVESLKTKWNKILSKAPIHLVKLDFRLEEENLATLLKDIDREINFEHQLLSKQEPASVQQRHRDFFEKGRTPSDAKKCLERLSQMQSRFSIQYPSDSSLNEQFGHAKAAYGSVFERLKALNQLLEEIPQQWTTYRSKFVEVVHWMDTVDSSLAGIMNEVGDAVQFEIQKAKFLEICRDVDRRREDMKLLVQMLDNLVSRQADDEALKEQDLLEALIQRYKNLVPTIEVTMIRTETYSKCYTYREDTQRICKILQNVEQLASQQELYPDSLEEVEQMIDQQKNILRQLETQRGTIMTLLQRGKDLQKDSHAPTFVQSQVNELDSRWTEIYTQSNEKLNNLNDTHKVWTNYRSHRTEILNLLAEAEDELKRLSSGQKDDLAFELKAKQNISDNLRKATEDTLKKLNSLCQSLVQVSRPEKKDILEKEVEEIERRLLAVLDLLDQKIHRLQAHDDRWNQLNAKIEGLREWMKNTQKLLQQLLNTDMSPVEKVDKTRQIQYEITVKLEELKDLEREAQDLGGEEEVQVIAEQVGFLKQGLSDLHETVSIQKSRSSQAVVAFAECKSELERVTPWIEQAQVRIAVEQSRPASLQEIKLNAQRLKEFAVECEGQKAALSDAQIKAELVGPVGSTIDELDAAKTKWISIDNAVSSSKAKMENLAGKWEKYDLEQKKIDDWVQVKSKTIAEPINIATLSLPELEKRAAELTELSKEISVHQSQLLPLTYECDTISQQLAPEGSKTLNTELVKLKGSIGQLSDSARAEMNSLADIIASRRGLDLKIVDFEKWMNEFSPNLQQKVYFDNLNNSISSAQRLAQEHSYHRPQFTEIYEQVKNLTTTSPTKEVPQLNKQYSELADKYQSLEDELNHRKVTLLEWDLFHNWASESKEAINHTLKQLETPSFVQKTNDDFKKEIQALEAKCKAWEPKSIQLEEASAKCKLIVLNSINGEPVKCKQVVSDIWKELQGLNEKLNARKDKIEKVESQFSKLQDLQGQLVTNVQQSSQALLTEIPEKVTINNLQYSLQMLTSQEPSITKSEAKLAEIRNLASELMQQDPSKMPLVTEIVQSSVAKLDQISTEIPAKVKLYKDTIQLWENYLDKKNQLENQLESAEQALSSAASKAPQVTDSSSTAQIIENLKKANAILNECKPIVATTVNLNNDLATSLAEVQGPGYNKTDLVNEVLSLQTKYTTLSDSLGEQIPKYEAQLAVWNSLESNKKDLIAWLTDTFNNLEECQSNAVPNSVVRARLEQYRKELDDKINLKHGIEGKIEQLQKLNPSLALLPAFNEMKEIIDDGFEQIEDLATEATQNLNAFEDKEQNLKSQVKLNNDKIAALKEKITRCESRIGAPTAILERIELIEQVRQEGAKLKGDLQNLEKNCLNLKTENPIWDDNLLKNEVKNLDRRLDSQILGQIETIEAGLFSALEKNFWDNYHNTGRQVGALTEKIKWCEPKSICDNATLLTKQAILSEIGQSIAACHDQLPPMQEALKILAKAKHPKVNDITSEYSKLINDLDFVERNFKIISGQMTQFSSLWSEFDKNSENVEKWLKAKEDAINEEVVKPLHVNDVPSKLSALEKLQQDVLLYLPKIEELNDLGQKICALSPEAKPSATLQFRNRHQALTKTIANQINKLKSLDANKLAYNDALASANDWIKSLENEIKTVQQGVQVGSKPNLESCKKLKEIVESKTGHQLVSKVIENCEALIPSLTNENKDLMREESRQLRDKWDLVLDNANSVLKQMEALQLEWTGIEDTYAQLKSWFDESNKSNQTLQQSYPNLPEKKEGIFSRKVLLQELASHGDAITGFQAKVQALKDQDVSKKLSKLSSDYENLIKNVQNSITKLEGQVTEHEAYNRSLKEFIELMNKAQEELEIAAIAVDEQNSDRFESIPRILADYEDNGSKQLSNLKATLSQVLQQTRPDGHQSLQSEFDKVEASWTQLLQFSKSLTNKLKQMVEKKGKFVEKLDDLSEWINAKEAQVKDQGLKSTAEAKRAHLVKLNQLDKEVCDKAGEFNSLNELADGVEGNLSRRPQLLLRYQCLHPLIEEQINRYKLHSQDHESFNKKQAEFLDWINVTKQSLSQLSNIVGDTSVLQDRRAKLSHLIDSRDEKARELETLIEEGERLYAHTSPDGREIVRRQIRTLRDDWETLGDLLQTTSQRVDSCLSQFGDFSTAQEELTQWLRSVEQAMQVHTQLQGTLPEKSMQLQNHRLMVQEIALRQPLVEAVCDKAQQLVDFTKDASLQVYIPSIKQLFQNIKSKSNDLLEKLELCVQEHTTLNNLLQTLNNWVTEQNEKLNTLGDTNGEKVDIVKRLELLNLLGKENPKGQELLQSVQELFHSVSTSTSVSGAKGIELEISGISEKYSKYLADVKRADEKLNACLKRWQEFDSGLQSLTHWFREQESIFRSQPSQPNLAEKEQALKNYIAQRQGIIEHEPTVNTFLDKSHELMRASATERVKPLVVQIGNRYQLLLVLSKEVVNRWEGLVEDHRAYQDKLSDAKSALESLETNAQGLDGELNVDKRAIKLQGVLREKEQVFNKINTVASLAEKLYPDTSAEGREEVRLQLHSLRERFEKLDENLNALQKRLTTESQQLVSFQESLAQVLAWLDGMEAASNEQPNWLSLQDTRSKLLKLKATLQDVISHRKIIDGILEKTNDLAQKASGPNLSTIQQSTANLSSRYEKLLNGILSSITNMDEALDGMQQWSDTSRKLQDWQKTMWEQLNLCTDYSGGKQPLFNRLEKIRELSGKTSEGENILGSLATLLSQGGISQSPRAKEVFEKDIVNLRFDQEKLVRGIQEIEHKLEEKLKQWVDYDKEYEHLTEWLNEAESILKSYELCNTLKEKEDQLQKYQDFAKTVDCRNRMVNDFLSLADSVQQALLRRLREHEGDLPKLESNVADLVENADDKGIQSHVQQVKSRFQSLLTTTKDVIKKCDEIVKSTKLYSDKYDECTEWLKDSNEKLSKLRSTSAQSENKSVLEKNVVLIQDLVGQVVSNQIVNTTVEYGEKLYPNTGSNGREVVRDQLQEIQRLYEALLDSTTSAQRDLEKTLDRWAGFDECKRKVETWLTNVENSVGQEFELKCTLDEKRAQLQKYRSTLQDLLSHQEDVVELKEKASKLPQESAESIQVAEQLVNKHQNLLDKMQSYVAQYEAFVCNHQQYMKAVQDMQDWLESTNSAMNLWSSENHDRSTLLANLEKLTQLQQSLPEERYRVDEIKNLAEKVLPGTHPMGQQNLKSQVDSSQQEWESLCLNVNNSIDELKSSINAWKDFQTSKEECMKWLTNVDEKLHQVDLKPTLETKSEQLNQILSLQGQVRARELEVDAISEKASNLQRQALPSRSSSATALELTAKYQQVVSKVKDLTTKWKDFVSAHQDFQIQTQEYKNWLKDIQDKLSYCSAFTNASQKDLETKLDTVNELILRKDEGYGKVQQIVELAQAVLVNTSPNGHDAINEVLEQLQGDWSKAVSKMLDIKNQLDENLHKWAGFLEQIQQLNKTIDQVQTSLDNVLPFQVNLQEKRAQLETIKSLQEKLNCEKDDVDNMKVKASEMVLHGRQVESATKAQEVLKKYDVLSDAIRRARLEREAEYKDYKSYKEAHEELLGWLNRARERIPSIKQPAIVQHAALAGSFKDFDVKTINSAVNALMNKKPQGSLLVERLQQAGDVAMRSVSEGGKQTIQAEVRAMSESFETLFAEIEQLKNQLDITCEQFREWKLEYEKLSDWLQQCEILIKAGKTSLVGTLDEKKKQVTDMKDVMQNLHNGREQLTRFNKSSAPLLASPILSTFISGQLDQLNSRYQAQLNIGGEVLNKVEVTYEHHREFLNAYQKARSWIDEARTILLESTEGATSAGARKEKLQSSLARIQGLAQTQDEGQNLVQTAVGLGEKAVRNTRSDGRDAINEQIKELQSDWDKLIKKITSTKVSLETNLLQWADYNTSYSQVEQWISDREAKLQNVAKRKGQASKETPRMSSHSIGDRKATLRATNTIVQDIVSLEPMIESVTTKAGNLNQEIPATEITTKYQTLSKQAKEIYAKQKEMVKHHQAFVDLANAFMAWLKIAKEKLGKCSEPVGDRETLSGKIVQLKVLQSDVAVGQDKLRSALAAGNDACDVVDEDDRQIIEEEVALLQEEFDNYNEVLAKTQQLLEVGLVRWKEWEDQFKDAEEWLSKTEEQVKSFHKLQNTLTDKKNALEQFQSKLQEVFDWQKTLDKLNVNAQMLVETCADSRVSNSVTQLSTKFNALLALSKEVIRRLESQYQEHQQYNTVSNECQEWIENMSQKLDQINLEAVSAAEVKNHLDALNGMKQTVQQGQNKLHYVLELKEKVLLTTEPTGSSKIQEDVVALQAEFDKLMARIQDIRQALSSKSNTLQDLDKIHQSLLDWIEEMRGKINVKNSENQYSDLSEKRAISEKLKILEMEIVGHADQFTKFEAKMTDLPVKAKALYQPIIGSYNQLKVDILKFNEEMKEIVAKHDKYVKHHHDTNEYLRNCLANLQNYSSKNESKEALVKKLEELHNTRELSLKKGAELVELAKTLAQQVLPNSTPECRDSINDECRQLQLDLEKIASLGKDGELAMKKCLSDWNNFDEAQSKVAGILSKIKEKIEAESRNEHPTLADLQKSKDLLAEVSSQKPVIDDLSDHCEALIELGVPDSTRGNISKIHNLYGTILAQAQELLVKHQKGLSDHTEFLKSKDLMLDWLKNIETKLSECIAKGDEKSIKQKYEIVQEVGSRMTEGQHLLNVAQDACTAALSVMPDESEVDLKNDMNILRDRWDSLNLDLKTKTAHLKDSIQRWEDFRAGILHFLNWCTSIEEILAVKPSPKAEFGDIKTLYERYKIAEKDIEKDKKELDRLVDESKELSLMSQTREPELAVSALAERWAKLLTTARQLKTDLEMELDAYSDYHNHLQECEKWLLQTSFQLMAHNSLCITNREQTLDQLHAHDQLLEEIDSYRHTIEDLQGKGEYQIKRYKTECPSIEEKIGKQLRNVQESYNSLLGTARQIKERLIDSLKKFQDYEDTMDSIDKNLKQWKSEIEEEVKLPLKSAEESTSRAEKARVLHNKLQGEKNRLSLAVQACEAATASLSRPTSPEQALLQPIPDKEIEVRSRLEDCIDKVQNAMSQLSSMASELEAIQNAKDGLNRWVDETAAELFQIQNKPSKLRSDAAQLEINHLKEIVNGAEQRQMTLHEIQLQEKQLVVDQYLPELLKKLENVATFANPIIQNRLDTQGKISEYRTLLTNIQEWLEGVSTELELLEKGGNLDCNQKIETCTKLSDKLVQVGHPKVESVKSIGAAVMNSISNVDSDIVEEQLNGIQRRFNDLKKRIERKQQLLETTRKSFQEFLRDLNDCKQKVDSKKGLTISDLGFQIQPAENLAASVKNYLKEMELQQEVLSTLERRFASIQNDIEKSEMQLGNSQLATLETDFQQVNNDLKNKYSTLVEAVGLRKKFADSLDGVKLWISHLSKELSASSTIPLQISDIERKLAECKRIHALISDYVSTTFAQVLRDATGLERDCNSEQAKQLKETTTDLQNSIAGLLIEVESQEELLQKAILSRQELESNEKEIQAVLDKIQLATAEKNAVDSSQLQKQLLKYRGLWKELEAIKPKIQLLAEKGSGIAKQLNDYDKQSLGDSIKDTKQKFDKLSSKFADKINGIESGLQDFQALNSILDEHRKFIKKVRDELADLSRPTGSIADDSQGQLGAHEVLLNDLKDCRKKLDLAEVKNEYRSHPEFIEVQKEEDGLAATIEAHIAKLRHLILLQQQYQALVGEIRNFLAKYAGPSSDDAWGGSGRSVADKIKSCDEMIVRIQDCEAKLASAYDKGYRIGEDATVSMSTRNGIMQELQDLKQDLTTLRRAVEAKKSEHELTAAEHKRFIAELDTILAYLHDMESQVKARPTLAVDPACVDEELRKHELLRIQIGEKLVHLESIESSLKNNNGEKQEDLPSILVDKLSESRRLVKLLPQELDERLKYLEANKGLRVQHQSICEAIKKWVANGEVLLKSKDVGVDFDNLQAELVEYKKYFNTEKETLSQLQLLRQLMDKLWQTVPPSDQEPLSQNFQTLNEMVQNTCNNAKSRRAHLDQMVQLWKTYLDLLNAVQGIITKCQLVEESASTLLSLKSNLQNVNSALTSIKTQQCELDNLNERGQTIQRQGDLKSSQKVEAQLIIANTKWRDAISRLESRKESLSKLVTQWENCELLWHKFELGLSSLEEHFAQVDPFIKSHQQLQDTKLAVQNVLKEAKSLEPTHDDLVKYAECILAHLKVVSEPNYSTLKSKLEHLSSQYSRIIKLLEEKLEWLNNQQQQLTQIDQILDRYHQQIAEMQTQLNSLSPFDPNMQNVNLKMKELENKVQETSTGIADFETKVKEKFDSLKQLLPPPIVKSISNLELELEKVQSGLKDAQQQSQVAFKTRATFKDTAAEIEKWVGYADKNLQSITGEPQIMKDNLQTLTNDLPRIMEQYDALKTASEVIMAHSPDLQEKKACKETADIINGNIERIKKIMEERKAKIGESLDSWQRFLQLWRHVMNWVEDKKKLLAEPLTVATLPEARQKFNVYAMNVSSLRSVGKQLSEMGKEIDQISQISSCASLHEKLVDAEQRKAEIEALLLERNSLLQETVEEWEQYEKKIREVSTWLTKSKQKLADGSEKRKPLRDQLASREKQIADIHVQKTKISLSLEKLQVHFKNGIGGDPNIEKEGNQRQLELDQFHDEIKRDYNAIEAAVSDIDRLQQEIQLLRNQTISIEQQLRILSSPSTTSKDPSQTNSEIASWKEKLRALQSKITARTERIKLLMESGVPIPTPLD